jgi:hypothetical protein
VGTTRKVEQSSEVCMSSVSEGPADRNNDTSCLLSKYCALHMCMFLFTDLYILLQLALELTDLLLAQLVSTRLVCIRLPHCKFILCFTLAYGGFNHLYPWQTDTNLAKLVFISLSSTVLLNHMTPSHWIAVCFTSPHILPLQDLYILPPHSPWRWKLCNVPWCNATIQLQHSYRLDTAWKYSDRK